MVKTVLMILVAIGMLSTIGVLLFGMLGLTRGDGDPLRSNRLMRWRVLLQGATLLLFALLLAMGR